MSRKKTSSITELVKIVVEEVIDKKLKVEKSLLGLRIKTVVKAQVQEEINKELTRRVIEKTDTTDNYNSFSQRGEPWSHEEDSRFMKEYNTAIQEIAIKHSRSTGAIKCRIEQNFR